MMKKRMEKLGLIALALYININYNYKLYVSYYNKSVYLAF